jgi:hypothetical protein
VRTAGTGGPRAGAIGGGPRPAMPPGAVYVGGPPFGPIGPAGADCLKTATNEQHRKGKLSHLEGKLSHLEGKLSHLESKLFRR